MISRRERRFLTQYVGYREHPPTFPRMALRYFFGSAVWLIHATIWAFAYWMYDQSREISCFAAGLSLGMISLQCATLAQFVRSWPFFELIFDWAKVDELLKYGSVSETK